MKKNLFAIVLMCFGWSVASFGQQLSQPELQTPDDNKSEYIPVFQYWKEHNIFQHLDASVSMGSTGIGVDVSSPIGEFVQLRAGFSIMPKFEYKMNFGVQMENSDESTFNRLADMMHQYTGYRVNNSVDMIGEPTWNNWHVLVDVFPFKENKHWHFTAGVFMGPSRVAKAYNTTEDMPSLLAVGIYNQMYVKALNYEPMIDLGDIYKLDDPDVLDKVHDAFQSYGRMGVRVGNYAHDVYDESGNLIHEKGKPYMMEPDEDGMVKVDVKTNWFRPYLGFGYGGRLIKGNDKYKVSFDAGMMFWGGTPAIYTHDGTNLAKDVENIGGKVGDYVDLLKAFKVFPVINVRITRSIF